MYRSTCLQCCRIAAASNRRNFVTSGLVAADPSTASTSNSVEEIFERSHQLQIRSKNNDNSKGKGKARESLTDVLRAQAATPAEKKVSAEHNTAIDTEGETREETADKKLLEAVTESRGRRKPGKRQARKKLTKAAASPEAPAETNVKDPFKSSRKARLAKEHVYVQQLATIDGIGTDSLRPTSESGFVVSQDPQVKADPFAGETAEDAVVAKMTELMQPLLQRCAEDKGTQGNTEFRKLRAFLKYSVEQYGRIRKHRKQLDLKERFVREIETSKWFPESATAKRAEEEQEDVSANAVVFTSLEKPSKTKSAKVETKLQTESSSIQALESKAISAEDVVITPIAPLHEAPVATLAHGLERILFNPGTHWLQDPRTDYYNFPPEVQKIPSVAEFDFDRLPTFMRPSQDPDLRELLQKSGKRFAGSTSSLTSALSQIYFALNGQKPLNTQSQSFIEAPRDFSAGVRLPASLVLRRTEEGQYLIDADKAADSAGDNVLSEKGHILEKMLTYPPEEFERFLKTSKNPLLPEESRDKKEAYHYSSTSSLLMRSQLDCHDPRLPRQTFDIKTRGSIALRRDMLNHYENFGYTITKATGDLESFEREKYDLIRSAFLKYSMQVRIGAMDGIFLAYHSGERIFGFEYLSLEDLDKYISGSHEESQQAFRLCLGTLETMLERAVDDIPGESLRVSFEAFNGGLQVYAQPLASHQAEDDSTDKTDTKEKLRNLVPGDLSTPLLLYDVQFTNYLNGYELRKSENVDFLSWRNPGQAVQGQQEESFALDDVDVTGVPGDTAGLAEDNATPKDSMSAFSKLFSARAAESKPVSSDPITWSISLDIALSTDTAFNQGRLAKLRKRQGKFNSQVILPEGLTKAEVARAVKGVTPEEEQEAISQGGKGGWSKGRFKPRSGVQYVERTYGIVGELRKLAKAGREKLQSRVD